MTVTGGSGTLPLMDFLSTASWLSSRQASPFKSPVQECGEHGRIADVDVLTGGQQGEATVTQFVAAPARSHGASHNIADLRQ
jgi:hypothetical protein